MKDNNTSKSDLESFNEIFNELEDTLINSLKELPVFDLSKVEESTYERKKGTYVMEMSVEYTDENANPVFDKEIWRKTTKYLIKRCRYVEFSCWHTDKESIEEIIRIMPNYDKKRELNQIDLKGEITEDVKELITENFFDEKGNIKWFYISLFVNEERGSQIFHSNHYGRNYIIDELDEEDIKYIKSIINEDEIAIDDIVLY